MHLRLIEIENFRGIKHLSLKLDVITAVYGEGSFGKSSLIEALQVCLSSLNGEEDRLPVFKPEDFHAPPGQDETQAKNLSITLTFREGTPAEWDETDYAELSQVINEWRTGRSEICMRIEGEITDSEIVTRCSFLDAKQTPIRCRDIHALLKALRKLSPVVILRWRDAVDHAEKENHNNSGIASDTTAENSKGAKYILSVYRKAVSQPDRLTKEELAAAVEALHGFEESFPHKTESARIAKYRALIDEIAETSTHFTPFLNHKARLSRFGDFHQVVALLAIVGTLLEARETLDLPSSAQPIFAIENLETNLHPIALASIWDLLAQIPVQKLMTTNSDDLLASVPLKSLRRAVRTREGLTLHSVRSDALSTDDIRRIGYHLRLNRADAIMARCWLLVEGESEGWLLPEMAHILGYDFKSEGVRCVEFAQCGIEPLIKLAQELGIQWHLLCDGDNAGQTYARIARSFARGIDPNQRVSCMREYDIEHHLSKHGFMNVYAQAAGVRGGERKRGESGHNLVKAALKKNSKPAMIMKVIEQAQQQGVSSVSPLITNVVETSIRLARMVEPEFTIFSTTSREML